jgi:hypothetical protein
MEQAKKDKWKRWGMWIAGITLAMGIISNIVFVTYNVALGNAKTIQIEKSMEKWLEFREAAIKGNSVQAQINEKLIGQLNSLEWRVNRLDKAHKLPPKEWDDIKVP